MLVEQKRRESGVKSNWDIDEMGRKYIPRSKRGGGGGE